VLRSETTKPPAASSADVVFLVAIQKRPLRSPMESSHNGKMKIVLKVGFTCLNSDAACQTLARAAAQFVADGHAVIVVYGAGSAATLTCPGEPDPPVCCGSLATPAAAAPSTYNDCFRQALSAAFACAGIPAFGLCATDGYIARIRKAPHSTSSMRSSIEIADCDPFWLNTIAHHGGVPLLANLALNFKRELQYINADQLAATVAVSWDADVFIVLTRHEGVLTQSGMILRWCKGDDIHSLRRDSSVDSDMLSKLSYCQEALERGVRRACLVPVSQIDCLLHFCQSKNECGTEVVLY
jgi:acetylglutamate kinase